MASTSPPGRNSFTSGLLVGCSFALILFILLILFCGFHTSSSFYQGPTEREEKKAFEDFTEKKVFEDVVSLPLPQIDPTTPVADLLPSPPKTNKAPVYLGDDLSCVPELMLEATPKATTDEWKRRKAQTSAVALHLISLEE